MESSEILFSEIDKIEKKLYSAPVLCVVLNVNLQQFIYFRAVSKM